LLLCNRSLTLVSADESQIQVKAKLFYSAQLSLQELISEHLPLHLICRETIIKCNMIDVIVYCNS